MLVACRTRKYWNPRTCLFTYNAKSNLLFMQVIFLTRVWNSLPKSTDSTSFECYRSRFSETSENASVSRQDKHIDGLLKFATDMSYHHIENELNSESSDECGHSFSSVRFYVLFNSLFRVLFNFPSRYLFAIGLVMIFSFGTSLRPTLA